VRRYLRPRRQTAEAGVEEQPATAPIQESPQETPTPTDIEQPEERVEEGVQLGEDTQLEEGEGPEGAVIITSQYVARLERESEDANNLIRDLGESVERVDALRDKLKEDRRRIGELRERLEQGIAEVNALRTQIEEDTSRVDELIR
jgi:chromosome segregation ATPase